MLGKCPLLIPTGKDNHGGGGTVGGGTIGGGTVGSGTVGSGTVGAWRPQALASPTAIIGKEMWFSSHTPSTRRERPNSRRICT